MTRTYSREEFEILIMAYLMNLAVMENEIDESNSDLLFIMEILKEKGLYPALRTNLMRISSRLRHDSRLFIKDILKNDKKIQIITK